MELFFNFLFWLFLKFIFNVFTTVVFLSTVEIQLIFFFYLTLYPVTLNLFI